MHEQRTESPRSSEGHVTRRLEHLPVGGTPSPQAPAHSDQRRVLAFVLIGLGLAMLFSNMRGLPFLQLEGRERTYTVATELDGATAADVHVDWDSGSLRLNTGQGDDLVSGSVVASRPMVLDVDQYGESGERTAEVLIRDQSTGWLWNGRSSASGILTLNQQPLYTSLALDLGSGSSDLDLSQLNVSELHLDAGSGRTVLQIPAQGSIEGEFELGSGSLNMTLPPTMEARIELDMGSGGFDAGDRLKLVEGEPDDGVYETPGYEDAQHQIELEISGGSGSIEID